MPRIRCTKEEQIRILKDVLEPDISVSGTVLDYCLDLNGPKYCDCLDEEQLRRINEWNKKEEEAFAGLGLAEGISPTLKVRFEKRIYDCTVLKKEKGIRINLKSEMRYPLGVCFAVTNVLVSRYKKNYGKKGCSEELRRFYAENPSMRESLEVSFNQKENLVDLRVKQTAEGILAEEIRRLASCGVYDFEESDGQEEDRKSNKVRVSHGWMEASRLQDFKDRRNCVYYLAGEQGDGKPALLYVGKAKRLGSRLKIKKRGGKLFIQHPIDSIDYDFTHFRFDEFDKTILPAELERAEEALIGGLRLCASERFPHGFAMTNLKFCKAYNKLITQLEPPFFAFEICGESDENNDKI